MEELKAASLKSGWRRRATASRSSCGKDLADAPAGGIVHFSIDAVVGAFIILLWRIRLTGLEHRMPVGV